MDQQRRLCGADRRAGEMGAYGSDHHYDFVLDRLLSGLRATLGAEPG